MFDVQFSSGQLGSHFVTFHTFHTPNGVILPAVVRPCHFFSSNNPLEYVYMYKHATASIVMYKCTYGELILFDRHPSYDSLTSIHFLNESLFTSIINYVHCNLRFFSTLISTVPVKNVVLKDIIHNQNFHSWLEYVHRFYRRIFVQPYTYHFDHRPAIYFSHIAYIQSYQSVLGLNFIASITR